MHDGEVVNALTAGAARRKNEIAVEKFIMDYSFFNRCKKQWVDSKVRRYLTGWIEKGFGIGRTRNHTDESTLTFCL